MKKIFTLTLLLSATLANAQSTESPLSERATFEEFVRNVVILLMIYIVTSFILTMIKLFLDNRLKKSIIETGTPESVVALLIPSAKNENKNSLKWFCVLITIAIGLGVIGCYRPSEIYALMIMTFCLALGFGTYFLLSSRFQK